MLANPELAALHPELKLKADKARSNSGPPRVSTFVLGISKELDFLQVLLVAGLLPYRVTPAAQLSRCSALILCTLRRSAIAPERHKLSPPPPFLCRLPAPTATLLEIPSET